MNTATQMPPWPYYEADEREAVDRILRSGKVNYWTGRECREFEREFADYHGVAYGVSLANGTLALELALRVLGIGKGDEVIVTPRSFFASASCIVQVGATPIFADVDLDSQNVTAESIAEVITEKTKAIIAVHLAGWPCDMPSIMETARQNDLVVIEDCAQSHGAAISGQRVGSFGDAAAFSFCQDKIMSTTGEGGMLLVNDKALWEDAWSFKDHGKSWSRVHSSEHPPGFRWLHDSFGTNWRMTEIQGAVGRLQLRKLDEWLERRTANAARLVAGLEGIDGLRVPRPSPDIRHANYKFYAFVDEARLREGLSRDQILVELEKHGCPGLSGSCPEIYLEAAFDEDPSLVLPNARLLGNQSMMLPVHPTLENSDLDRMVDAIRSVFRSAVRD